MKLVWSSHPYQGKQRSMSNIIYFLSCPTSCTHNKSKDSVCYLVPINSYSWGVPFLLFVQVLYEDTKGFRARLRNHDSVVKTSDILLNNLYGYCCVFYSSKRELCPRVGSLNNALTVPLICSDIPWPQIGSFHTSRYNVDIRTIPWNNERFSCFIKFTGRKFL